MSTGLSPDVFALLNSSNRILGLPGLPGVLEAKPPPLPNFAGLGVPGQGTPSVPKVAGIKGGAKFDGQGPVAVIAKYARQFGLDPAAVLAYALEESSAKYGAVGDHGTSFGPFQAHIGGAAGNRTPQAASAWANSPQGLIQMMGMMARGGARGLKGDAAVRAIYAGFGKGTPAAIPRGLARYAEAAQELRQAQAGNGPAVVVDHQDKIAPLAVPILKLAAQYLGTPYHWGGASPQTGFDCSGFVQWLYGQKGIQLPRTTYQQFKVGKAVNVNSLKPGDIVFFEPSAQGPGHEGLYIGNGQFIQAPHTGDVVKISKLSDYMNIYVGARRIL